MSTAKGFVKIRNLKLVEKIAIQGVKGKFDTEHNVVDTIPMKNLKKL
jgi:hypothetical protein